MPATPYLVRVLTRLAAGRGEPAPLPPARTLSRRKAPRAVVWGVVCFAAVQLGLGLASELYPRIRDPLYGDKLVKLKRRLPAAERPPTVVMLGSSRTGLAFHGKRVEAQLATDLGRPAVAFNYGIPASGPVTHLVYLNRLLGDGIKPDLLIVEVLPSMLADLPGDGSPIEKNWFYADRLTSAEREIVIRHGFAADQVQERWWKSVLLPAYTLRFQLLSRISASWLPWQVRFDWSRGADECGWGAMMNQAVNLQDRQKGIARAYGEYAPVLADLKPGGPAVGALRELLAHCKDCGIPVRLVLMPEGSEFRRLYPPHVTDRLTRFLAELTAEAGVPPVVDARAWLPDEHFYDSHHMLAAGAVAFSDRLTREVIAPALKERPDP
jgi:hypothetical protein